MSADGSDGEPDFQTEPLKYLLQWGAAIVLAFFLFFTIGAIVFGLLGEAVGSTTLAMPAAIATGLVFSAVVFARSWRGRHPS